MNRLLLVLVLATGCATHHVGDCATCVGWTLVQELTHNEVQTKKIEAAQAARDDAQTKQIYGEVGKALQAITQPRATPAAVTSESGDKK